VILPGVNKIRYFGNLLLVMFLLDALDADHAKCSFYHAANAIFAKVGCFASEEVILELTF